MILTLRRHPLRPALALATVLGLPATARADAPQPAAPKAAPAPAKEAPKWEFETWSLVLLMRPANAPAFSEPELQELQQKHLAHLEAMGSSGKMVVAGPFGDQRDPAYRGACIYRVPVEEARTLAESDPMVKAGRLRVEVLTWAVGKGYMTFPKAPPLPAR